MIRPTRRPEGAHGCSHGWSGAAAQPADAEPVVGARVPLVRPAGAEGSPVPWWSDPFAPSGRAERNVTVSTGCATLRAASLHPWLQTVAPSGRVERNVTVPTGCATRRAASLHPWLQTVAPSGRAEGDLSAQRHPGRKRSRD